MVRKTRWQAALILLALGVGAGASGGAGSGAGDGAASSAAPSAVSSAASLAASSVARPSASSALVFEPTGDSAAQPLRLEPGNSAVINARTSLRRVLVSNPDVIVAVATTPRQVVVEGKAAGSSALILWGTDGSYQTLRVTVDVGLTSLRTALRNAFPHLPLDAQADGKRVLVTGAVPDQTTRTSVLKMAGAYSDAVVDSLTLTPPAERQILLEVRFVEVDRTRLEQFGANLISTGALNMPGVVGTQQFGSVGGADSGPLKLKGVIGAPVRGTATELGINNLLNLFFFRPDLNFGATVQALEQKNVLQILAEPNLLALPGVSASFLAGGEFPFPVIQGGANVGAVTIQFRPFGVRLQFQGTLEPDNVIRLDVRPEVSTLDFSNAVTISGFTVPAIATRRAETVVELRDGQAFGIAGLLDQRTTAELRKLPGVGDLPILGQLFRSHEDKRSRMELMVLVSPHILDPAHAPMTTVPPSPAMGYLDQRRFDRGLPSPPRRPTPSKAAPNAAPDAGPDAAPDPKASPRQ